MVQVLETLRRTLPGYNSFMIIFVLFLTLKEKAQRLPKVVVVYFTTETWIRHLVLTLMQ